MLTLDGLKPELIWSNFEKISKIPRCSGKEKDLQNWLEHWASVKNLDFRKDEVGNIILTHEAAKGCEDFPTLILQSHQDMVCEKDSNSAHNFNKDPIPVRVEGNIVKSEGTSLGADNGIGLSVSMALLSDQKLTKHGKIEALMTVEEETGLKGALSMKAGFFTGKHMINLDSEEAGVIIIGSAGGCGTQYKIPYSYESTVGWLEFRLDISGLLGGHSGVDIHLPRANANKLLGVFLVDLKNEVPVRLVRIEGGTRGNAIPRSASCVFQVPVRGAEKVEEIFHTFSNKIKDRYPVEKEISIKLTSSSGSTSMDEERTTSIIGLINDIHNGVFTWSKSIDGLVETSNNLGVINTSDGFVKLNILSRSSDIADLKKDLEILYDVGNKNRAEVTQSQPSPGWKTDIDSPFLKMVASIYESVLGEKPKVTGIHGGLECGQFSRLVPDLSVVSIGPTIKYPHSPQEFVYIDSVNVVWNVVRAIAERIGETN
jgi:dipeptidase D